MKCDIALSCKMFRPQSPFQTHIDMCYLIVDDVHRQLMETAMSVRTSAYCPYSNFRVGAAILCEDNNIISGLLLHLACDP